MPQNLFYHIYRNFWRLEKLGSPHQICKGVKKETLGLSFKYGHQGFNISWDIQAESVHEVTYIAVKMHWKQ